MFVTLVAISGVMHAVNTKALTNKFVLYHFLKKQKKTKTNPLNQPVHFKVSELLS